MPTLRGLPLEHRLATGYRVDPDTGCHVWTRSKSVGGYGTISLKHKYLLAHRVAYEFAKGPIPAGLQIDHLCRNRACCNPLHLEAVTGKVNHERGAQARRTHCPHGHAYDHENTYRHNGRRICRACVRNRTLALYYRKKAAEHDVELSDVTPAQLQESGG